MPVLANLIIGLFGQFHFRNKTPIVFTIGATKLFVKCFHYSISIQIIICDILYRLSLPLVFETFVTGSRHLATLHLFSLFVYLLLLARPGKGGFSGISEISRRTGPFSLLHFCLSHPMRPFPEGGRPRIGAGVAFRKNSISRRTGLLYSFFFPQSGYLMFPAQRNSAALL